MNESINYCKTRIEWVVGGTLFRVCGIPFGPKSIREQTRSIFFFKKVKQKQRCNNCENKTRHRFAILWHQSWFGFLTLWHLIIIIFSLNVQNIY